MLGFMESAMKFRPVFWSGVVLTPVLAGLALTYGRQFDDYLAGRLLQVAGGFIGLGWSTWMFLEVGQGVTRLFRLGQTDEQPVADETRIPPSPKPARPPLRRAA